MAALRSEFTTSPKKEKKADKEGRESEGGEDIKVVAETTTVRYTPLNYSRRQQHDKEARRTFNLL
jgi:hypothetical protein